MTCSLMHNEGLNLVQRSQCSWNRECDPAAAAPVLQGWAWLPAPGVVICPTWLQHHSVLAHPPLCRWRQRGECTKPEQCCDEGARFSPVGLEPLLQGECGVGSLSAPRLPTSPVCDFYWGFLHLCCEIY